EVCAALAASHRSHGLDDGSYRSAIRAWESYWAAVRPVELTAAVESSAGRLAASRSLRGADAVHLASALAVGIDDLVLAVWDRRLHEAAVAERLSVAPVSLS
ncbi:MAG: type II toxin-antitoxin system VapC family toxin, partial [Actinobacteria bacterium]|nr:type II toxin-antitoxin system VapC family toxin [Actinomycetota bacterium]